MRAAALPAPARPRGAARVLALAALVLPAAACLEVDDTEPPMCKVTADCDAGEVCDEGVCWGNPPAHAFAAVVSPPGERSADLVSRELLALEIAPDGWTADLHLERAVSFKGRLQTLCEAPLVCDGRRVGASITVTRPSSFRGGPGFRRVLTVDASDDSFEIMAPMSIAERVDTHYTMTIVPDERDLPGSGTSLAQLVPPLRVRVPLLGSSSGNVIELGGLDLPRISGKITSSTGEPLANYRVVALGRWAVAPDQPPTEVSTVDFTGSDGSYSIVLSRGLVDTVEIVARPIGAQLRPELHLGGVPATQDASGRSLALPTPQPGSAVPVEIVVTHQRNGGEVTRIAGARVAISGQVSTGPNAVARFAVEGTTDSSGLVRLQLLDAAPLVQAYRLSILPPPSSPAAALFERPYAPQATLVQQLGTRFAITGRVVDATGHPVQDVSVTARPSLRFLWSLEPGPQAFAGAIPAATAVTPNTGEFVVFVDHAFANTSAGQPGTVWGHYELSFEPSAKSRAPILTRVGVELPRDAAQSALATGVVTLPDPAYVRGHVFDDDGQPLEGAEIKLYRVTTDASLCTETRYEPASCPIPAELVGRGASDDDGIVRLTLPR